MLPKVKRARISNESQGYGYASDGSANEQEDVGRKRRKAQVPSTETTNVAVTSGGGLPADPSWTVSRGVLNHLSERTAISSAPF